MNGEIFSQNPRKQGKSQHHLTPSQSLKSYTIYSADRMCTLLFNVRAAWVKGQAA